MNLLKIKIINKRIGTDPRTPLPTYATDGSAGMDLRACIDRAITLIPGPAILIPTGIAIYIENPNYAALILPRSGLSHKHGIVLGNSVGLIDSDYQGEMFISALNRSDKPFIVQPGDRLAQLVIVPVMRPTLEIVESFDTTERGSGGWGSTGR